MRRSPAVRALEASFDRLVPRRILDLLGVNHIEELTLQTHRECELTVLFSDLRDFTSRSERSTPGETLEFLNDYLSVIEPVIERHRGAVDKFIGDAVMALFPARADDAVACAVDLLTTLESYNTQTRPTDPLRAGVGLNTGLVMVGAVGGPHRLDTTVIGDAVNLASRLETLTKTYRTPLVIGEQTLYRLRDQTRFDVRLLDRVVVKGKLQPQAVYEVFSADPDELRAAKRALLPFYEAAVAFCMLEQPQRAVPLLQSIVERVPNDEAAKVWLARAKDAAVTGRLSGVPELPVSLAWRPEYELDHPLIDSQHRELAHRIDRLAHALRHDDLTEVDSLLEFVGEYATHHFHDEETLMGQTGYPFARDHVWQHHRFVESFARLSREIRSGAHDRLYLAFRVQLHLVDWFVTHSTGVDRHFTRWLAAHPVRVVR